MRAKRTIAIVMAFLCLLVGGWAAAFPFSFWKTSAGPSGDPDAANFFARVATAGGTVSPGTQTAVETFVVAAKAHGYWSKLARINLFCGDQLAAALVPLKVGAGNATDTNINFVGGDYTEATGLQGGSGKYLDTGALVTTLTIDDTHLAIYNRDPTAEAVIIGANVSATIAVFGLVAGSTSSSRQYRGGAGFILFAPTAAPLGLMIGSRVSTTSHVLYQNGVARASQATTAGVLPALNIYVFALNDNNTAVSITLALISSYSFGSGLTATEVTNYTADLEAFQDALGRGVAGISPTPEIFWGKMNEASGSAISTDVGPDGTTTATRVAEGSGYALRFAGGQSAVFTGVVYSAVNKLTWCGRVKFNDTTTLQMVAEASGNSSTTAGTWNIVCGSGLIYAQVVDSAPARFQKSVVAPATGSFVHLTIVFDNSTSGGNVDIYFDGVLQTPTVTDSAHSAASNFGAYDTYLGSRAGASLNLNADLDDVRIYNRALSGAEIAAVIADPL